MRKNRRNDLAMSCSCNVAIQRPRTRTVAACQVSNAHEQDLVKSCSCNVSFLVRGRRFPRFVQEVDEKSQCLVRAIFCSRSVLFLLAQEYRRTHKYCGLFFHTSGSIIIPGRATVGESLLGPKKSLTWTDWFKLGVHHIYIYVYM